MLERKISFLRVIFKTEKNGHLKTRPPKTEKEHVLGFV
jgi:hypothetical protein